MPCAICNKKMNILPNNDQDDWINTNIGMVHLNCFINNKDEDIKPLTNISVLLTKDRIRERKGRVKL